MTNKERQNQLDKRKWLESEEKGKDMSGWMKYCCYCDDCKLVQTFVDGKPRILLRCNATQEERETACLCAKAYNRMYRGRKWM